MVMKVKCWDCGEGVLVAKRKSVSFEGVRLGTFAVDTCPVCGGEFVGGESADSIDRAFERAWIEGRLAPPKGWKPKARGKPAVSRARAGPQAPVQRAPRSARPRTR